MPSGTDLITWDPRVGATGDDRYDIPSDTAIAAGASDYSDPPTIAEINARSGVNQIIAEFKRRRAEASTSIVQNFTITDVDYVASGDLLIYAGDLNLLDNGIDSIRQNEEQSAYSWPSFPSAGSRYAQGLFSALRKSMAIDYWAVYLNITDQGYTASPHRVDAYIRGQDATYPTTTLSKQTSATFFVGQHNAPYSEYRAYLFFQIPSGLPTLGDAKLSLSWRSDNSATDFNIDVYRSNTHLATLDTGDWGNLDNLESSLSTASITVGARDEFDVSHAALSGGSGTTFILVSDREVADTTPSGLEYVNADAVGTLSTPRNYPILKLYTA